MQRGPYDDLDDLADQLQEQLGCRALALVVLDGPNGCGMAVVAAPPSEALRLVRPLELLTSRLAQDIDHATRQIGDKVQEN